MSEGGIWVVGADGELTAMRPSAPRTEDDLQSLIARHRDLIGEGPAELLLVKREQGISDSEESAGRWSLDHLFVTRDAIPVLVEVKRAVDTRLRREVVGQMLDYAANGASHWSAGTAVQSFDATCAKDDADPEQRLTEFLGPEMDPGDFWKRMDQNFRDGRIKMLFVADTIPPELATIVEFLNEHTRDHVEVRAIELRHFAGEGGLLTLVRRDVGNTARARVKKSGGERRAPISIEEWIERDISPGGSEIVSGVSKWMEIVHRLGAETVVASTHGSIVAMVQNPGGKQRYPTLMNRPGRVAIAFDYTHNLPGLKSEETRRRLLERFNEAIGPLSTANLKGAPSFPVERLNDQARAAKFEAVLADWFEAVLVGSTDDLSE